METKENDKKQYEISFLAKEEGGAKDVAKFIKDLGGEIELEGPVAKIALAYPIQKETAAFFGYFHCALLPEEIKSLEHELNVKAGILRHLIITPPFKKGQPRQQRVEDRAARTAPAVSQKAAPARAQEPKSETLTNEELEKKIEEILK